MSTIVGLTMAVVNSAVLTNPALEGSVAAIGVTTLAGTDALVRHSYMQFYLRKTSQLMADQACTNLRF